MLLAAAPMLASAHNDSNNSGKASFSLRADTNMGLHLGELFHKGGDNDNDNDDQGKQHATSTPAANNNGVFVVAGTVSAVNGSSLTLMAKNGTTYTVNGTDATVTNNANASASFSSIRVGDQLVVRGTLSGSTITADKVADGGLASRTFLSALGLQAGGTVTSVNGSTLTIKPYGTKATTTITTDASTIYRLNGNTASSSALTVGSKVFVNGTTTSDTSIAASIINIFSQGWGFIKHLFR